MKKALNFLKGNTRLLISLLLLVNSVLLIYQAVVIHEYKGEVRVQKALNMACEADRIWLLLRLEDAK